MWLTKRVEHLAILGDLIDAGQTWDRRRVDCMNLDQRLGKLRRKRTPRAFVFVIAQDLARGRFTGDVGEDHVGGAELGVVGRCGDDGRGRDPGSPGSTHSSDLGGQVANIPLALALNNQLSAICFESPGVTRGTTRQPGEVGDLGGSENGRKPFVEPGGH